MKLYHCPECGSMSPLRRMLLRSAAPCPRCDTSLVETGPRLPWMQTTWYADVAILGAAAAVAAARGSVGSAWLCAGALLVGTLVDLLARGHWVKETLGFSDDDIRARVQIANGLVRHGATLREAAEKLSVAPAVLRVWRERYETQGAVQKSGAAR